MTSGLVDAGLDPTYYHQSRLELVKLVQGRDLRVLELGCASGALGAELKARGKASVVHGVEMHPEVADGARGRIDRVWAGDVETLDPAELDGRYDVLITADILEHVRDPWSLLRRMTAVLAPGGQLVASIPNVRYLPVVADLMVRGRFEYRGDGVLDRTHLRFFTRRSIHQLVTDAGFTDVVIERRDLSRRWKRLAAAPLRDLGARQFLVHARLTRGDRR
ncbi:MAG: class I SAM-dependent methyltransferase [Actinobacteria bacterium]|nr:class I SAM-dependent methyltransferase [Actinomycetota bacterium]